jgi:hypothetical protein
VTTLTSALELNPFIGGKSVSTSRSPYDDELVAVIHRAGPAEIESARTPPPPERSSRSTQSPRSARRLGSSGAPDRLDARTDEGG